MEYRIAELMNDNEKLKCQLQSANELIEILQKCCHYMDKFVVSCQCDGNRIMKNELMGLRHKYGAYDVKESPVHCSDDSVDESFNDDTFESVHSDEISNTTNMLLTESHSNESQFVLLPNFKTEPLEYETIDTGYEIRVKCPKCDTTLANKKNLKSHLRIKHNEERPFKCTIGDCDKSFKANYCLSAHIKITHSNEKPYACEWPNCEYKCKTKIALNCHERTHTKEKVFTCPYEGCTYSCHHQSTLCVHKRTHKEQKQLVCDWPGCEYTTFNKNRIKSHHMIAHTAERPIKCEWPGCEYRCKIKDNLRKHMMMHSVERNYVCAWPGCDKTFKKHQGLKNHMYVHNGERPYTCEWPNCNMTFNQLSNKRSHYNVHIKDKKKHKPKKT